MLRYIKVNDAWLDTLRELRDNHIVYLVIDGYVTAIYEDGTEDVIGVYQGESDGDEVE